MLNPAPGEGRPVEVERYASDMVFWHPISPVSLFGEVMNVGPRVEETLRVWLAVSGDDCGWWKDVLKRDSTVGRGFAALFDMCKKLIKAVCCQLM